MIKSKLIALIQYHKPVQNALITSINYMFAAVIGLFEFTLVLEILTIPLYVVSSNSVMTVEIMLDMIYTNAPFIIKQWLYLELTLLTLLNKTIMRSYKMDCVTFLDIYQKRIWECFGSIVKRSDFFKPELRNLDRSTISATFGFNLGNTWNTITGPEQWLNLNKPIMPSIFIPLIGPTIITIIIMPNINNILNINLLTGVAISILLAKAIYQTINAARRLMTTVDTERIKIGTGLWSEGTKLVFNNSIITEYNQQNLWEHYLRTKTKHKISYGQPLITIFRVMDNFKFIFEHIPLCAGMLGLLIEAAIGGHSLLYAIILYAIFKATDVTTKLKGLEPFVIMSNEMYDTGVHLGVFNDLKEFYSLGLKPTYKDAKATIPSPIDFNITNLQYNLNGNEILKGVSFSLKKKEKKILLGCNGAGKTTLVNVLTGNYRHETKTWNSSEILALDQNTSIRQGTLIQNILLNLNHSEELKLELNKLKERLGLHVDNDRILSSEGGELSGGEKKKLELLRAYFYLKYNTYRPILLIDEILANLDPASCIVAEQFINSQFKDHSMIIITHEPTKYQNYSCMILEDGKIVEEGSLEQLKTTNAYQRYIKNL